MNTLAQQRKRLEAEIISVKDKISVIKSGAVPDIKAINLHKETIERNMQLIAMIDNHLKFDHRPMWRKK